MVFSFTQTTAPAHNSFFPCIMVYHDDVRVFLAGASQRNTALCVGLSAPAIFIPPRTSQLKNPHTELLLLLRSSDLSEN